MKEPDNGLRIPSDEFGHVLRFGSFEIAGAHLCERVGECSKGSG